MLTVVLSVNIYHKKVGYNSQRQEQCTHLTQHFPSSLIPQRLYIFILHNPPALRYPSSLFPSQRTEPVKGPS